MRELFKSLGLSAALLLLPAGNSLEVKAAVGFVEDLAAGRTIGALFRIYPHLQDKSSNPDVTLTDQEDNTHRWLQNEVAPSFKGCEVRKGWVLVLDGSLVRVIFDRPCGNKEAYGVDVQVANTERKFHPTGEFTLLTNGVL